MFTMVMLLLLQLMMIASYCNGQIVFNEIATVAVTVTNACGGSEQFIELYNSFGTKVDLGGLDISLCDSSLTCNAKYTLPSKTFIAPEGFLLLCQNHFVFTINSLLSLYLNDGCDTLASVYIPNGGTSSLTYQRDANGMYSFLTPTPNMTNYVSLGPVPVPAMLPAPIPVTGAGSIPIPSPMVTAPIPIPVPIPMPDTAPVPLPVIVEVPIPLIPPASVPLPVTVSAPVPLPVTVSAPVPLPVIVPVALPVTVPVLVPVPVPVPKVTTVVFNEFATSNVPNVCGENDRYIELYNTIVDSDVDISGWKISICATEPNCIEQYIIPSGTSIAPNGLLLFCQSQLGFTLTPWTYYYLVDVVDIIVTQVFESNGCDTLSTYQRNIDGSYTYDLPTPNTTNFLYLGPGPEQFVFNEIATVAVPNACGGGTEPYIEFRNTVSTSSYMDGLEILNCDELLTFCLRYKLPLGSKIASDGFLLICKSQFGFPIFPSLLLLASPFDILQSVNVPSGGSSFYTYQRDSNGEYDFLPSTPNMTNFVPEPVQKIVFNEIATVPVPNACGSTGQYIELHNTLSSSVVMDGFKVQICNEFSKCIRQPYMLPPGTTIAPKGFLLICQFQLEFTIDPLSSLYLLNETELLAYVEVPSSGGSSSLTYQRNLNGTYSFLPPTPNKVNFVSSGPVPVPVVAPVPLPVKVPLPVPVKVPLPAPVKVPLPVPVLPVTAPHLVPITNPLSSPVQNSMPPPPVPVLAPVPGPVKLPVLEVPTPRLVPIPNPVSVPVKNPIPALPFPVPVPTSVLIPISVSAPAKVPILAPVPDSISNPIPAPIIFPVSSPAPTVKPIAAPFAAPVLIPLPVASPLSAPSTYTPVKIPIIAPVSIPILIPVPITIAAAPVSNSQKVNCGIFGWNLFCPINNECGFFRRLFNIRGC